MYINSGVSLSKQNEEKADMALYRGLLCSRIDSRWLNSEHIKLTDQQAPDPEAVERGA